MKRTYIEYKQYKTNQYQNQKPSYYNQQLNNSNYRSYNRKYANKPQQSYHKYQIQKNKDYEDYDNKTQNSYENQQFNNSTTFSPIENSIINKIQHNNYNKKNKQMHQQLDITHHNQNAQQKTYGDDDRKTQITDRIGQNDMKSKNQANQEVYENDYNGESDYEYYDYENYGKIKNDNEFKLKDKEQQIKNTEAKILPKQNQKFHRDIGELIQKNDDNKSDEDNNIHDDINNIASKISSKRQKVDVQNRNLQAIHNKNLNYLQKQLENLKQEKTNVYDTSTAQTEDTFNCLNMNCTSNQYQPNQSVLDQSLDKNSQKLRKSFRYSSCTSDSDFSSRRQSSSNKNARKSKVERKQLHRKLKQQEELIKQLQLQIQQMQQTSYSEITYLQKPLTNEITKSTQQKPQVKNLKLSSQNDQKIITTKPSFIEDNPTHPSYQPVSLRYDLNQKKKLTVKVFKNTVMIDFREMYQKVDDINNGGYKKDFRNNSCKNKENNNEWFYGKKGISLSLDQWAKVKELIPVVDQKVSEMLGGVARGEYQDQ